MCSRHGLLTFVLVMVAAIAVAPRDAHPQTADPPTHDHRVFLCTDDGLKANNVGCELLGKLQFARLPEGQLFWHLNRFQTREAAEAAKTTDGLVVEAAGRFWLYTFGPKDGAPKSGEAVASIGPLQLTSATLPTAKAYEVVAYLAVMPARAHTRVHTHPGPEAWYVLAGQQCLETPEGTIRAGTGDGTVVRPSIPMRLTNDGSSTRRALFIVIHDAAQPWSTPTDEWKPTGACDRERQR